MAKNTQPSEPPEPMEEPLNYPDGSLGQVLTEAHDEYDLIMENLTQELGEGIVPLLGPMVAANIADHLLMGKTDD